MALLGIAVLGVVFGIALMTSHAGFEWPLILRLPMLAVVGCAAGVACLGLWGLMLAASPKLRRHAERLESDPKHKRRVRKSIEKMDSERLAKRRKRER